ncbi:hypothetical protein JWG42_11070 [Desulfoprunum benzoelyticum]|uniref:Uncharacterized protein n=1 Tax=Desulfoprunum benzoelyticum TaxID=1506996 RepID=A0A840V279_9BACT|nr:hypothetical protein [Desulfoprunum benzoelyticum]MBB5347829.1 hypothetical protein [Desulfoprunum benzoelyticum]MBM9530690.1 hypothetical protein [Desulfoprunum benzoelyticum]
MSQPKATAPHDTPAQPTIQAMVWYREEHWETLKRLFTDADRLPPTYGDWLQRAEEMKTQAQAAGDIVIKVYIDPETFTAWCRHKGLAMNAEARSQLAIEVAQSQSFSI